MGYKEISACTQNRCRRCSDTDEPVFPAFPPKFCIVLFLFKQITIKKKDPHCAQAIKMRPVATQIIHAHTSFCPSWEQLYTFYWLWDSNSCFLLSANHCMASNAGFSAMCLDPDGGVRNAWHHHITGQPTFSSLRLSQGETQWLFFQGNYGSWALKTGEKHFAATLQGSSWPHMDLTCPKHPWHLPFPSDLCYMTYPQ